METSWTPYDPQGVKGFDDDDEGSIPYSQELDTSVCPEPDQTPILFLETPF